jgi:hypothetical protein
MRRIDNTQGGGASLATGGNQGRTPAPSTSTGDAAAPDAAVQERLDRLTQQLAALQQGGGGALTFQTVAGNEIQLNQTFARPVAIGYRSVPLAFPLPAPQEKPVDCPGAGDARSDQCLIYLAMNPSAEAPSDSGKQSPVQAYSPPVGEVGAAPAASADNSRFVLFVHGGDGKTKSKETAVTDVAVALAKNGYSVRKPDNQGDTVGGPGVDYFDDNDLAAAQDVAKIANSILGSGSLKPRRQRVKNPLGYLGVWLY